MPARKRAGRSNIGELSFLAGFIIALVVGLVAATNYVIPVEVTYLLILLGLIVGFLNITQREVVPFLLAVIALLALGAAGLETLPVVGAPLGAVFKYIQVFVAPAALIVALNVIVELARAK